MKKYLLTSLLLPLSLGWAGAQTRAGTQIVNQVSADATVLGQPTTSQSNIVRTVINSVCSVSVTPNGTLTNPAKDIFLLPSEGTVLRYEVKNTGNDTATFPLLVRQEAGSAAPTFELYRDGGNGQLDPSDASVTSVKLDMGQTAVVFVKVNTTAADRGEALVNLVASCVGGMSDSDNISRINVGAPPAFSLTKAFGAAVLAPGQQTTVTINVRNTGPSASREVTLTDLLVEQVSRGLVYVPGSARTTAGTLEYSDGANWATTEAPAGTVRGLRLRLASLAAGAEAQVTFAVQASAQAENQSFTNVATLATSVGSAADAQATLSVRYTPGVALGPVGQPLATGAADSQTVPFALAKQETCFDHTVRNTGNVADDYTISVNYDATGVTATTTLRDAAGNPLPQPLTLAPGAQQNFKVCYVPEAQQAGNSLKATVVATGKRGVSDPTVDVIGRVEATQPGLVKSVYKEKADASKWTVDDKWPGVSAAEKGQTVVATSSVGPQDILVYNLSVTNPYTRPLNDVTISDVLPAHLQVTDVTDGGVITGNPGAQTVTWKLGTLAASEHRDLKIRVAVMNDTKDDEQLKNVFSLTSAEFPAPNGLESGAVSVYTWKTAASITKTASKPEVAIGDLVTYTLDLKNNSTNAALVDVQVTDTPSQGLSYVPGTTLLDGQPFPDPVVDGNKLLWVVDRLEPGAVSRKLSYGMRVTPAAQGELLNTVTLVGKGANGRATAIASSLSHPVTNRVPVRMLNFAPQADILGTVFVDNNGNGLFDDGDAPVSDARVILAGGRISQTDLRGRYHFGNVTLGVQALRLDPASVPYAITDNAVNTRSVNVTGLTTVTFPLPATVGGIGRVLNLNYGDVALTKTVMSVAGGYRVQVQVTSPRALAGFELQDALPAGATLQSGRTLIQTDLPAGTTTYEYTYRPAAGASASALSVPLTPPVVRWKE